MRVLDLYAGLGGLSAGFRQRGHDVVTLDNDEEGKFDCTLTMDALEFARDPIKHLATVRPAGWRPDVIVGGPPCNAFTVMLIGRNWHPAPTHAPKTDDARLGLRLVEAFLEAVRILEPKWWWMENPRAKLRRLPAVRGLRRVTVTYCQYGTSYQKPTDLWGVWPLSWRPRPMCKPMAGCHVDAPAGSRTAGSIQGLSGPDASARRAEAPLSLSLWKSLKPARIQPRTGAASSPSGV